MAKDISGDDPFAEENNSEESIDDISWDDVADETQFECHFVS